jgi:hypothetical protein
MQQVQEVTFSDEREQGHSQEPGHVVLELMVLTSGAQRIGGPPRAFGALKVELKSIHLKDNRFL